MQHSIFTIDTKALRRAGHSEAEIDRVWDEAFDLLTEQLKNAVSDNKGAKLNSSESNDL